MNLGVLEGGAGRGGGSFVGYLGLEEGICCTSLGVRGRGGAPAEGVVRYGIAGGMDGSCGIAAGMEAKSEAVVAAKRIADVVVMNNSSAIVDGE
jgi:hypothetical protein